MLLYGPKALYFDVTDSKEFQLRAPGRWLHSIRTPTFVFEGADSQAIDALMAMKLANTNSHVQFFNVTGADHFSVVGLQQLVVQKILRDTGPTCTIEFSPEEIRSRFNE